MTEELKDFIKVIQNAYASDGENAMVKNKFILRDLQRIIDFINGGTSTSKPRVKRTVYYFNSQHLDDVAKGMNKIQIGFMPTRTEYYDCPAIIEVQHVEYEFKILYKMIGADSDFRLSDDWYVSIEEWKRKNLIDGVAEKYEIYTPSKRVREVKAGDGQWI